MIGKSLTQPVPVVVIAGHQVERHPQRREQFAQAGVLGRTAEVAEVAGDDHCVGRLAQRQHRVDRHSANRPQCPPCCRRGGRPRGCACRLSERGGRQAKCAFMAAPRLHGIQRSSAIETPTVSPRVTAMVTMHFRDQACAAGCLQVQLHPLAEEHAPRDCHPDGAASGRRPDRNVLRPHQHGRMPAQCRQGTAMPRRQSSDLAGSTGGVIERAIRLTRPRNSATKGWSGRLYRLLAVAEPDDAARLHDREPVGDGARQCDPLALPARQLGRPLVLEAVQPDQIDELADPLPPFALGHPADLQAVPDCGCRMLPAPED